MITIEDFGKIEFDKVHPVSAFYETETLVKQLLKERDAYRQIARKSGRICIKPGCKCADEIDKKARRIYEGTKL